MPHPFFCFYHGDSSNEGCRTAGFSSESDLEDIVFRAIRSNIELIEGAMAEKRALMKAAEKEKDAKKKESGSGETSDGEAEGRQACSVRKIC